MHVITIDKIEVMNMEESKEEYIGGLGKKREGEMLCTCVCARTGACVLYVLVWRDSTCKL